MPKIRKGDPQPIVYRNIFWYNAILEVVALLLRSDYINTIAPFIDQPIVKNLAGIRRRRNIPKWTFRRILPHRKCILSCKAQLPERAAAICS